MNWDPETYMTFSKERTRPAMELLARVPVPSPKRVIDLGCGPGNSTALLAARWPEADIEGLESSPEMLAKARAFGTRARFVEAEVESWTPRAQYDVVFSNATLHWIGAHGALLPRLMGRVAERGVLAFQVPRNFEAPSHRLMREVAADGPWAAKLEDARPVNVLSPEEYYDILAPVSASLDIWETCYLHVLEGEDPVFDWVSGTGLRPFVQRLDPGERENFLGAYRARLREAYPQRADGKTLFPFQRLFAVAHK